MMTEEWKTIKDFPNYMVSNLGNVKSLNYKRLHKEKLLKQHLGRNGYLYVYLYNKNIKGCKKVHKLVAEAFLEKQKNCQCINHINANKLDNRLVNIEWCTYSHNIKESYRLGHKKPPVPMLGKKGELCPNSKKINQYDLNGNFIKSWSSLTDIQNTFGYLHQCISKCALGYAKSSYGYIWKYENIKKGEKKYEC